IEIELGRTSHPLEAVSRDVITAVRSSSALEQSWSGFANESEWPTSQVPWVLACAQTFEATGQLHILIARGPDHIAVAPLVKSGGFFKHLEMLGSAELFEPCEFSHTGEGSLAHLAGMLLDSGLPVFLPRVPAESPTVRALVDACRNKAVVIQRP